MANELRSAAWRNVNVIGETLPARGATLMRRGASFTRPRELSRQANSSFSSASILVADVKVNATKTTKKGRVSKRGTLTDVAIGDPGSGRAPYSVKYNYWVFPDSVAGDVRSPLILQGVMGILATFPTLSQEPLFSCLSIVSNSGPSQ